MGTAKSDTGSPLMTFVSGTPEEELESLINKPQLAANVFVIQATTDLK
jgi:hypothetical protein